MESTQPILRCRYSYDPLDRLISQLQPDVPAHQRFYCKSRLATEIQGATRHSIFQNDDLLLAQQQREGDALDTTLLATDLQRSVLHTVNKGLQPPPIAYSPYGHRPALNGLLSLLGFNGERLDPVTGHYLLGNGYRAFNPHLMRFNSPDNLSPFGKGGLNTYAYCLGDPINRYDPNGHFSITKLLRTFFSRFGTNPVRPAYKSGPETLFTTAKNVKTLKPDNSWQELTTWKWSDDDYRTKAVIADETTISTKTEHSIWTTTKRNPTLQELIYSTLNHEQMSQLPPPLPYRIDRCVDLYNMKNAAENIRPALRENNLSGRNIVHESLNVTAVKATEGVLTGVHPEKARLLIRDGIYPIY